MGSLKKKRNRIKLEPTVYSAYVKKKYNSIEL